MAFPNVEPFVLQTQGLYISSGKQYSTILPKNYEKGTSNDAYDHHHLWYNTSVVVHHYWKSRLCRGPETLGKGHQTLGKAFAESSSRQRPDGIFFSATILCRALELQALGTGCAESPQWAVGQKK
jgi:hypothetical protein